MALLKSLPLLRMTIHIPLKQEVLLLKSKVKRQSILFLTYVTKVTLYWSR